MPARQNGSWYAASWSGTRRCVLGTESASPAHSDGQSKTSATRASTAVPTTARSRPSNRPCSRTARCRSVSGPACGSIAEWNRSEPCAEARHWK